MSADGGMASAPGTSLADRSVAILGLTLRRIGWEIREADLNLATGVAVLRLFRADGRWLHVSATATRASIERWQRRCVDIRPPGGPLFAGFTDMFLGRTRCAGARSALRATCDYLTENPAPGCETIGSADVRDAFRLLVCMSPAP